MPDRDNNTLPYIHVTRLPPAASFYASITQPLGLRYISASATSLFFGTSPDDKPVFEVRKADESKPLKRTRIVFAAPSPAAIDAFRTAGLQANPGELIRTREGNPGPSAGTANSAPRTPAARALIRDLDDNIMEVATPSKDQASSRILDWNYDVAASEAGPAAHSDARTLVARQPCCDRDDGVTVTRRTITHTLTKYAPPAAQPTAAPAAEPEKAKEEKKEKEEESSPGFSTGALFGSVLGAVAVGAAVGAGLTYYNMRNDRDRAPRQEYDYPMGYDPNRRYIEVERTVERIRYPEDMAHMMSSKNPPPSYVARYSGGPARSRVVEDVDDDRASRHGGTASQAGSRARGQSEAGSRRPLLLEEAEHNSIAGSKYTVPKMLMETEYRSAVGSRHSQAPEPVLVEADYRSHVGSRYTHVRPRQPTEVDYRSRAPSMAPSKMAPSRAPSMAPSKMAPSRAPSMAPSRAPTKAPTVVPAPAHSQAASKAPSKAPSRAPTAAPSRAPSKAPPKKRNPYAHLAPNHRLLADMDDKISYVSGSTATVKAPAPAPAADAEADAAPVSHRPPEAETYVSARTHRSDRPPKSAAPGGSRRASSRAPTRVGTARHVRAPSRAGTARSKWDDDVVSLAPSDSISCYGGRK